MRWWNDCLFFGHWQKIFFVGTYNWSKKYRWPTSFWEGHLFGFSRKWKSFYRRKRGFLATFMLPLCTIIYLWSVRVGGSATLSNRKNGGAVRTRTTQYFYESRKIFFSFWCCCYICVTVSNFKCSKNIRVHWTATVGGHLQHKIVVNKNSQSSRKNRDKKY